MFKELSLEQLYLQNKKSFEYALFLIRTKGYNKVLISKKNGKLRELNIPQVFVKNMQSKINTLLNILYTPPKPVHGFIQKQNNDTRNIISNASKHIKKYIVINIDIENFFDTINFGRVRGLFISKPFELPEYIATRYAQLITYENKLPQGSPTSPIISNIICKKLDHNLIYIAKQYSLTYTRYADDITFSSYKKNIDTNLFLKEVDKIILNNGFHINPLKTRIQLSRHSQIVTGLKVNQKVNVNRKYIRQIRSMLYSWFKIGLTESSKLHFEKYNKQSKKYSSSKEESFKNILLGKINFLGQVKGNNDVNYIKFRHSYYLLSDNFILTHKQDEFEEFDINNVHKKEVLTVFNQIFNSILIFTEGETDITYIKNALIYFQKKEEFKDLNIRFVNLRGWVNVKNIHRVLYDKFKEGKDLLLINTRECILPYLTKELKFCFVLDADDDGIIKYFKHQQNNNYFLLDEKNKGYIEKLIDKELIIKIIHKSGFSIIPSKSGDKTKSKLEKHLKSNVSIDNIFSIDNYIIYKDKLIKKTDLAKIISEDNTVKYDNFKSLFIFLKNMKTYNQYGSKKCCTSIY